MKRLDFFLKCYAVGLLLRAVVIMLTKEARDIASQN